MILKRFQGMFIVLMAASVPAFGALVEIGDAGNTADTNPDSDRSGMGSVDYTYSIGETEVSVAEFNASPLTAGTTPWTSPSDPITGITRVMAAQYCNWLTSGDTSVGAYTISGGAITGIIAHDGIDMDGLVSVYSTVYVLPTEDEWYKAAYYMGGGDYSSYANGTEIAPSTAQSRYATASPWAVGSGPSIEQNDTKDMMGNVWEWMEDAGTLRGGAYSEPNSSNLRAQNRLLSVSDAEYDSVGMRVVAIPEPGTISLMGLSTVSLFATRTVRRRKTLGQSLLPVRRVRACDLLDERAEEAELLEEGLDLSEFFKAGFLEVKAAFQQSHESISVRFWNHMVVKHERRIARRAAFRTSAKKRALGTLDAFLALIMK